MPDAQTDKASAGPSRAGSIAAPEDVRDKSKRYQSVRLRLFPVRLLFGLFFPILTLLGPSRGLATFLAQRLQAWPYVVAAYFVVFSAAYTIWLLPLNYYQGYSVEKRFGLSNETAGSWFRDWLKGLAVSALIGLPVVLVVYALLRYRPDWWWFWAGVAVTLFGVLLANLAPILIYPLFFKFEPLEDETVRDRLSSLADRSETPFSGIYRMELSVKSSQAEAMLTGMGHTRRIVLSDTLLDNYDVEEIEVVLAHELGHHARMHLPLLVAMQAAGIFAGLYLVSIVLRLSIGHLGLMSVADVANLPLLLLVLNVLSFVATPGGNWWSRRLEVQADGFALALTRNPAAFITAMRRLADQNLSDIEPSGAVEFLLYGHPAIGRRIEMAEAFAKARGLAVSRPPVADGGNGDRPVPLAETPGE